MEGVKTIIERDLSKHLIIMVDIFSTILTFM